MSGRTRLIVPPSGTSYAYVRAADVQKQGARVIGRAVTILLVVLAAALWLYSGSHNQQNIGGDQATVQSQLTTVAGPTPSATP